ncbi:MAG: hypothetical protein AUK36_00535 [Zetaproteobacteria bacterium CG2_30_59_37]|nr:MAG: hypothetical protein AUK36_00535 [Zetaproteobacteria bacterium CG2_30_59_37]
MSPLIRFSFPLSPRMQGFLQVRDALACLEQANVENQPYVWLQACADLCISLFAEQGRRPGLADVTGLLSSMQVHLDSLAKEHPRYCEQIMRSCATLERHERNLRDGIEPAMAMLSSDALIHAWLNGLKKHDWLGHQSHMPHAVATLWSIKERRQVLHDGLQGLHEAVKSLHDMLHDFVGWEHRVAVGGGDHVRLERDKEFGLLIVGLTHEQVLAGLIPDISGNRMAIRLRFQCWQPGKPAMAAEQDVPYQAMMVPVA